MPRVSEEHLAARRRQILEAALRSFRRSGFHATSMQDVIAEAGLSVGAVYRYFTSKSEIVAAIAQDTVGGIATAIVAGRAAEPPGSLLAALDAALAGVEAETGPDGVFPMAVQVWAEAVRDPALKSVVQDQVDRLRTVFAGIAEQAVERGELPAGTDPAAVGTALLALIPGFALQRIFTGGPDRATFAAGVAALLAATPARPPGEVPRRTASPGPEPGG